jgi:hypothetical protein
VLTDEKQHCQQYLPMKNRTVSSKLCKKSAEFQQLSALFSRYKPFDKIQRFYQVFFHPLNISTNPLLILKLVEQYQ